jgi:hypothetical protein
MFAFVVQFHFCVLQSLVKTLIIGQATNQLLAPLDFDMAFTKDSFVYSSEMFDQWFV